MGYPRRLLPDERLLLIDIVELSDGQQVMIHENMPADEKDTLNSLVQKGFVELRPMTDHDERIAMRPIVATGKGREMVRQHVARKLEVAA